MTCNLPEVGYAAHRDRWQNGQKTSRIRRSRPGAVIRERRTEISRDRSFAGFCFGEIPLVAFARPSRSGGSTDWFLVRRRHFVIALVGVVALVAAFALWPTYSGDGSFIDHGPFAAHERYVLDLGSVDLAKTGQREFHMAGLPIAEMTLGFSIRSVDGLPISEKSIGTVVRLRLQNEANEIVFDRTGSLSDWVWSTGAGDVQHAFVYLRGVEKEIPLGEGVVQLERSSVGADGGWGTYFSPRNGSKYQLLYQVITPQPTSRRYAVEIRALGGGWK